MKIFKLILGLMIVLGAVLAAGKFLSHSAIDITVEPSLSAENNIDNEKADNDSQASTISLDFESQEDLIKRNSMGYVYFHLYDFDEETNKSIHKFVRLPGLCVVGKIECPEPEVIEVPFDMQDFDGLDWSPDGKRAVVIATPREEVEWGITRIPPSKIYLFDAEENTWIVIFESAKYVANGVLWSMDGDFIVFNLHSILGDKRKVDFDQLYVIRPDGSDLKMLFDQSGSFYRWAGDRLLLQNFEDPKDSDNENFVVFSIDPDSEKATKLFSLDRITIMQPSPDGNMLAFADQQSQHNPTPIKEIRLYTPTGELIQVLGSYSNRHSGIYPVSWSKDSRFIAYKNISRVYIAEPGNQPLEVYQADDSRVEPSVVFTEFSPDSKYLLMDVNDGQPKFVTVSIDGKEEHVLTWPGKGDLDLPSWPSWSNFNNDEN